MVPGLWIAKTGMDAQQTRLAVIANNLANVNTYGYKKDRAIFEDLLYQNIRQVGGQSSEITELPSGLQLGTGSRIVATQKIHTTGNLTQTNNQYDIAINGRGYIQILMPDGTIAYTRDGAIQLNQDGQMVTAVGYELEPAIVVPENALSVTIGRDGVVSVQLPQEAVPDEIGALELADFVNPAGLEPIGENLFLESQASGPAIVGEPGLDGLGTIVQGALETSNVNVVEELVNMIETQRAYEMNARAVSTSDQMLQYLTNNV